jgi:hypothetical protein
MTPQEAIEKVQPALRGSEDACHEYTDLDTDQSPDGVEAAFEISEGYNKFTLAMQDLALGVRSAKKVEKTAQMLLALGAALVQFIFELFLTDVHERSQTEDNLDQMGNALESLYTTAAGNKRHTKGKSCGTSILARPTPPWLIPKTDIIHVIGLLIESFTLHNLVTYGMLVVDGTEYKVVALHHRATLHKAMFFRMSGVMDLLTIGARQSLYNACQTIWRDIVADAGVALANALVKISTNTAEIPNIEAAIADLKAKSSTMEATAYANEMTRLTNALKNAEQAIRAGQKSREESLEKLIVYHRGWTDFRREVANWIASIVDQATREALDAVTALWVPLRRDDGCIFDRDTCRQLRDALPFLSAADNKLLLDRLIYNTPQIVILPIAGAAGEGPDVAGLAAAVTPPCPLKRSLSAASEESEGAQGEEAV